MPLSWGANAWQSALRKLREAGFNSSPPMDGQLDSEGSFNNDDEGNADRAVALLDKLVRSGQVSTEKAIYARRKIEALHAAIEESKANAAAKERQEKTLQLRLMDVTQSVEGLETEKGLAALEARLAEEVDHTEEEAARARERAENANAEVRLLGPCDA